MTNSITDLIPNSVNTGKDQTKTNQYQTKDNGKAFSDILNHFNNASAKVEQNKMPDNRLVKDRTQDNLAKNKSTVDNNNLKQDNDLVKKTVDKVKSNDVGNHNLSKDISDKKNEKSMMNSTQDVKKSDNSDVKSKDKTDLSPQVTTDSKAAVADESNAQIKDNTDKNDSISDQDNAATSDDQESTANNSSTKEDDSNSQTDNSTTDTATASQASDDKQSDDSLTQTTVQAQVVAVVQPELTVDTSSAQNIADPTNQKVGDEVSELAAGTEKSTATAQAVPTAQSVSATQSVTTTQAVDTTQPTDSSKTADQVASTKDSEGAKLKDDSKIDETKNLHVSNTYSNDNKVNEDLVAIKDVATEDLFDYKKAVIADVNPSLQIKSSSELQVNPDKKVEDKTLIDLTNKTPLEQAILNELDAEVTDSSQNSGNSFLKQQDASEQVVKLSIEPLVKPDGVDFSNVITQEKIMPQTIDKTQSTVAQVPVKGLNQLDVMNQINDKLTTFKSGASEKIEIILKPENLGKVNVEIQSLKGVLSATLVAENQQVKELLEKNIDSLRNNLNSQGLNLNNVSVKVEEPNKSAFNNLNFGQGQFDSEANNHQQKSQNTYKSDYKSSMSSDSSSRGIDEATITTGELKNDNSLHVGMVDYKV